MLVYLRGRSIPDIKTKSAFLETFLGCRICENNVCEDEFEEPLFHIEDIKEADLIVLLYDRKYLPHILNVELGIAIAFSKNIVVIGVDYLMNEEDMYFRHPLVSKYESWSDFLDFMAEHPKDVSPSSLQPSLKKQE